jgi:predicted ABC-type ATPase
MFVFIPVSSEKSGGSCKKDSGEISLAFVGMNVAGKTTLVRELLPRMGLMRIFNADAITRDSLLAAFKAGRLLLEEASRLIDGGKAMALESALSGKTCIMLLRAAREQGYRLVPQYVVIGSARQAIDRVKRGVWLYIAGNSALVF